MQFWKMQKSCPWALEEFASILKGSPCSASRVDPWRRTSGMHKIKRRDQLAVIKLCGLARDEVAARQDIAPGKLLNDSAIVELAIAVTNVIKRSLKKLYVR
jgi:ribonuclease D